MQKSLSTLSSRPLRPADRLD